MKKIILNLVLLCLSEVSGKKGIEVSDFAAPYPVANL